MNELPLASRVAEAILSDSFPSLVKRATIGRNAVGALGAPVPGQGGWLPRAKRALTGGLGIKGNLALAGGTLAAGALGTKALRSGLHHLGEEAPAPTPFGQANESYRLPFDNNAYGVPQTRPL